MLNDSDKKTCIVTSNILLALRNADHIVFEYTGGETALVTCYKKRYQDNPNEYNRYKFEIYSTGENLEQKKIEIESAVFTAQYSSYDWEIQSIFGMLALRDEIELIWRPDSLPVPETNPPIFADTLIFVVYRDELRFYYKLGWYIGTEKLRMIIEKK